MTSTKTTSGSGASTSAFGAEWSDVANAAAIDGTTSVSIDAGGGEGTDTLSRTDWGFSIPSAATILGVSVSVKHRRAETDANSYLQLTHGGNSLGSARTLTNLPTSAGFSTDSAGGASDLWGASLTPGIVNASSFGVLYRADVGTPSDAVEVDGFQITVHYVEGGVRTRTVSRRGLGP